MGPRCIKIKYKKKRTGEPVVKPKGKTSLPPGDESSARPSGSNFSATPWEAWPEGYPEEITRPQYYVDQLRKWLKMQLFLPQDLSDDFLTLFLTGCGFGVDLAKKKLQAYFKSRQDPSPLFRDRDPLSPENVNILKKLYVMPMPETTEDGRKIIITGAVQPLLNYNQLEHAKALAMVFDLLIWEKDFGFGDYVIVFDGRGFQCPQLLENKVHNHRSIRSLLQDTIPGRLKSFYFLYPPPHVAKVASIQNKIWLTVVNSTKEMVSHLPADSLPIEYGGTMGRLGDLLEQWDRHMIQNREFFVEFERRMRRDYERRICHEEQLRKRGKNWVQEMKLVEDEWEYKRNYYKRMKCMAPVKHPAFGSQRILNMRNRSEHHHEPGIRCGPWTLKMLEHAFEGLPSEIDLPPPPTTPEVKKSECCCTVLPVVLELRTEGQMEVEGEEGEATAFEENQPQAPPQVPPAPQEGPDTERPKTSRAPSTAQGDGLEDLNEEKSESESEIDFEKELVEINNWLAREPYLPKNIDEEILITFLWDSQSVEQAEAKLMNYYYMRQSLYSVFRERHPCSPNNLLKYDAVCVIPLTCGTDKKWIIFATWLSHDNPSKFSMYHMTKLIFTELDILLQENQIRGKRISIIIDMAGYSAVHTAMITKFAAKRICRLFTDCFPATFNGFYIVNPPEHVADYTSLFQPFDFHIVEKMKDLQGFLPMKFLPSDMGGDPDAPKRNSLFEPFFKRMQRCGNWLAYEELVRSQEMMLRMTTNREDFVYGPIK